MPEEKNGDLSWEQTREEVLARDNHECRFCGMTQEEHREENTNGLEVHHIIPTKDGGDDTIRNLVALCTSCHRTLETIHAQALADLVRSEDYREDLEGLNRVYEKNKREWDCLEEMLGEWLEKHPVFREEIGFIDEGRDQANIYNYNVVGPSEFTGKGISSEWEALVAYGYKEGIADVTCDLDGQTGVLHEEFSEGAE